MTEEEMQKEESEMFRWFFRNPAGKTMFIMKGCSELEADSIDKWKERIREKMKAGVR